MEMEREIFQRTQIDMKKLSTYGFIKEGDTYRYSKIFLDNFRADIKIDEKQNVLGRVYDLSIEDEYINIRIKGQLGKFVNQVREEYRKILEDIRNHCCTKLYFITDQANRIAKLIKSKYKDEPEFVWEKSPGNGIFRNPRNNKWYGLIMNIDWSRIDDSCSGMVEVLNIKLDAEEVSDLLIKPGFYPAYHMNKKNWITIILNNTLTDDEIMKYIDKSHDFTETSNAWLLPSNPKFYDVIHCFDDTDTITWKQSNHIEIGDLVYIYVGNPYSTILYQCKVIEVDIPYHYQDKNLTMNHVMKIQLLKKYPQNQYTFTKLKEFGIRAIRGPRCMPKRLREEIEQETIKLEIENYGPKTDLLTIPNIGKNTKQDLLNIGIHCVEDLKGKDPEALYLKDCELKKYREDRCQLYLFRMAVYYAEHDTWEKEMLKWWYWKDKKYHNEK